MTKDYEVLSELIPKTQELHREIFDKGYTAGYKQGIIDNNGNGNSAYYCKNCGAYIRSVIHG